MDLLSQAMSRQTPGYLVADIDGGNVEGADDETAPSSATAMSKWRRWKSNATLTSPIITGTSTRGPITAAKAAPELIPNTATATAMASSKLLLAAVNDSVVVLG